MLKIGEKIPNLDLITHKGEKINLHDFKGKKIVLFFYPRANMLKLSLLNFLFYSSIQELIRLDVLQKRVT